MSKKKHEGPKVLFLDIETSLIKGYFWSLWEEVRGTDQIQEDWHILSWAAKWQHEDKMMYMGNNNARNIENDHRILQGMWKLLDEADIIITHNGKKFDAKKLNSRFAIWDMPPPESYKHIDTLEIAKRHFAMTSNKLEYLAEILKVKYKKLKHNKFPGIELWKECIKKNKKAWAEMEKYNKQDVRVLEAVYDKLIVWDNSIDFSVYYEDTTIVCTCGNKSFRKRGYHYTNTSKFQRYKCLSCGKETRGRENLFSKEKRASLRIRT